MSELCKDCEKDQIPWREPRAYSSGGFLVLGNPFLTLMMGTTALLLAFEIPWPLIDNGILMKKIMYPEYDAVTEL